jgi:LCP family protein required for cell wall assembly
VSDAPNRPRRGGTGIARHGRLRKHHAVTTLISIVASALAVVLVSTASVTAIAAGSLVSSAGTVKLSQSDEDAANKLDISAIKGGANILLVGSDTRIDQFDSADDVAGARNDVTILLHISQDHKQLTAVSFPRDLMVPQPSCTNTVSGAVSPASDSEMFNTALGNGGVACVVSTVENLTGLTIPYAGMITFDGVIAMSNAVGGVDVCVAQPINDTYTGLHLTAGEHTLQGMQALQFLRTRHGVGDGSDLARISSQQVFLSALLRKITSNGTLSNPITLYKFARAATSNMTLSDSLRSTSTMIGLAESLKSMSTSDMLFVQYPVADDPTDSARVIVDQDSAHALNVALQNDEKTNLSDSTTGRASENSSSGSSGSSGTSSGSSGTGTSSPTSSATASATSTALPSSITGQTAAEQTCSVGN